VTCSLHTAGSHLGLTASRHLYCVSTHLLSGIGLVASSSVKQLFSILPQHHKAMKDISHIKIVSIFPAASGIATATELETVSQGIT